MLQVTQELISIQDNYNQEELPSRENYNNNDIEQIKQCFSEFFKSEKDISDSTSEESNADFSIIYSNENSFNSQNKKMEKKEKINDIKENKNNKIFLIAKKRNIFKVVNPNAFFIFNSGNKDKYTRKFINEIMKQKKFIIFENRENSIKIIIRQNRKYDADNIRKKIKARFLKYLKNAINERLNEAGSKLFFSFLPQNFVCNIVKSRNRGVLNFTLEEIFSKNLCENENEESPAIEKYRHNLKVIDYLQDNQIISENSNFNYFKEMKFYEIYYEYLRSNEFEKEINRIKKKEDIKYIKLYIQLAANLINFFLDE